MTSHRLWLALSLVGTLLLVMPARAAAQGQPAPAPADSTAPAADAAEPIGNVATVTGTATVIRNKNSLSLHVRDDIFLNDVVQTSSSSELDVTFNDATTFHLSASAKITIDNFVYEDGGSKNSGVFDIGKGTIAFVAAAVAKTGNMQITTPTSTLGIRGTTGLVEVPANGGGGSNNVNIKLYPDADGHVGRIEVNDRSGARLGALTQGASGFAIRPGAGGARPTAVPLAISPQQAARDQGFVRQVHTAQNVGRQIVTEQRAARRANPNAPNRGNPPQTPQRPNQPPGPNRPGPQQGAPNRQGQQPHNPQQPNQKGRPGEKSNSKQGAQPAKPQRPGEKSGSKQGAQPANSQRPAEKPNTGPRTEPAQPERQGATPAAPQGGQNATPPQPELRQGAAPPAANRPAQSRPHPPASKGAQKGKREKKH